MCFLASVSQRWSADVLRRVDVVLPALEVSCSPSLPPWAVWTQTTRARRRADAACGSNRLFTLVFLFFPLLLQQTAVPAISVLDLVCSRSSLWYPFAVSISLSRSGGCLTFPVDPALGPSSPGVSPRLDACLNVTSVVTLHSPLLICTVTVCLWFDLFPVSVII